MLPVESSLTNVCYELTFASWAMENYPSVELIKSIVQEMIFYNLTEFFESEGLVSDHIQILFVQIGLSQSFYRFLRDKIEQIGNNFD